jgi:hypothetical protein
MEDISFSDVITAFELAKHTFRKEFIRTNTKLAKTLITFTSL